MKQSIIQMVGTFLLGLLVPCLVWPWQKEKPLEVIETTVQPTATTIPEQAEPVVIIVLDDRGVLMEMELEGYVFGVTLAEMPAEFEEEALKAQAVAARTYALKRMEESKHPLGAVCMDPGCCQAYISPDNYIAQVGTQAHADKVLSAVTATEGQVLTYEGELAETTYFSCSGGRTEQAAAVWGKDYPYLQAVDSPGEEQAEHYNGSYYFTAAEFASKLSLTAQGDPREWFSDVTSTPGGGVGSVSIIGVVFSGTQLRSLLELPSTAFEISVDAHGITVATRGKGHRVGMSQYGADAMALTGSSYAQILDHYYSGTQLSSYSA